MRKFLYLFLITLLVSVNDLLAQATLPDISVRNINGKIIVSWKNEYNRGTQTITVQRSFDSLKNFSSIGSVLNPQNTENGYADENPPYNKMYYRVFVSFDGGEYLFSKSRRPAKEARLTNTDKPVLTDSATIIRKIMEESNIAKPILIKGMNISKIVMQPRSPSLKKMETRPIARLPIMTEGPDFVLYPSRRIYTGKDNNIIVNLPDAVKKKYHAKFLDEKNKLLFELTYLNEDYFIIEKVNFLHGGWFNFELYENGKLIERNKFYIPTDNK